jgi:peptidoglycan/LPS O-acetylase OafA/YrhL
MASSNRSIVLDYLKGISILAVIVYHAGIFPYGYLGVDVFFVIAGYLTTNSIVRSFIEGNFSYTSFISNRLVRLWPLIILISILSLLLGYFFMVPAGYKNTSETSAGTLFFLNNVIQYITAKNYWDASNDFKPLMHTWYVSLLFQYYLIYPLVLKLVFHFSKQWKQTLFVVLSIISIISFVFYLTRQISFSFHFYMLPSRLYEFTLGGLVALLSLRTPKLLSGKYKLLMGLFFVILILITGLTIDYGKIRVVAMVAATGWILYILNNNKEALSYNKLFWLYKLGISSYSLYVWHQFILGFYRYIINERFSIPECILLIGISLIIGRLSYLFIEKPINTFAREHKNFSLRIIIVCSIFALIFGLISIKIYLRHGVVRDVPEMAIKYDSPSTWEPLEYNMGAYKFDKDFSKNGQKKVLVVGDSYARDWCNILREAHIDKKMNISYRANCDSILEARILQADIIFLATNGEYLQYADYLPQMMKKELFRIGSKCFFHTVGNIYNHMRRGYYSQVVPIPNEIADRNQLEKKQFGDRFIDLMQILKNKDGNCRIFTPDSLLITHDGLHLTKAGASYLANQNELISLFNNIVRK